jgi:hypothetical protein
MIDIVLNNKYDATFMMSMIFIHDFLHDFSGLSGRITKIKEEIEEFTEYLVTKTSGGGNTLTGFAEPEPEPEPKPKSRSKPKPKPKPEPKPESNFDDDIITSTKYLEIGESGTLRLLEKWLTFLESPEFSRVFKDINMKDIRLLIERYKILLEVRTRSSVRAVQIIKDAIYQTKLYVYGCIHSGKKVHNPRDIFTSAAGGSVLALQPGNGFGLKPTFEPKERVNIGKTRKEHGKFEEHNEYMQGAFNKAISDSHGNEFLVNYFKFMKKLYLYYEDPNVNPYTVFNNVHIENALTLYWLDVKHDIINDDNIHFILQSLQLQYMFHFGGEMKGGNPLTVQAYIETNFEDIFFVIFGAGKADDIYADYDDLTKINGLKTKIDSLITTVAGDAETMAILNSNYQLNKDVFSSKYNEYKGLQESGARKARVDPKRKDCIAAAVKLIKYIYNTVSSHINSINAELKSASGSPKSLSSESKGDAQMILVTIAEGGKKHILHGLNEQDHGFIKNTVFVEELRLIKNVISTKKVTSKTIDNSIRDSFITYTNKNHSSKILKSLAAIDKEIAEKRKRKKIALIDNAVSTDVFEAIKITKADIICPTSSVCDAQGSFGSCPASKAIGGREFFPMDFRITCPDESIYYHGKTDVREKPSSTEVKICFSAEVNNFFLPEVQIDIDIGKKNILVLSANETYKELLNSIITIWDRLFKTGRVTPEIMWEALLEDVIFTELVSCGAVKSVGDLFQEVNSVAEFGGYNRTSITPKAKLDKLEAKINGEFRIGANADQPSGVRAGYILLKGISGINPSSMGGYFSPGDGTFAILGDVPTDFSKEIDDSLIAPSKAAAKAPSKDAAKAPSKADAKAPSKAAAKASAVPVEEASPKDAKKFSQEELNKLTVDQLKEKLKQKGIHFKSDTRKAHLIELFLGIKGGTRKKSNNQKNKTRKYMKNPV